MIKLFIYIPTYNRPRAIRQQLNALYPQIQKHTQNVRLLINDNDTPNGKNDSLLDEYPGENIHFNKNPGNIGISANIVLGFVFARENEHLWILSDNDIVKENILDIILNNLNEENTFFVFPFKEHNTQFYPNDLVKHEVIEYKWDDNLWYCSCPDKNYVSFGIGIDNIIAISHGIYAMRQIKNSISAAFKYHNTILPHVAIILDSIHNNGKVSFKFMKECLFNCYITSKENVTDYTFLVSSSSQLINLLPKENSKKWAKNWLKKGGDGLYYSQFYYEDEYFNTALSRRLLIKKGGSKIFFFLCLIRLNFLVRTTIKIMLAKILAEKYFIWLKGLKKKLTVIMHRDDGYKHPITEKDL